MAEKKSFSGRLRAAAARGASRAAGWLSHPRLFFFGCLYMMGLLAIGTVFQKRVGLYQARKEYLSAFFFDFRPLESLFGLSLPGLPLPAGRLVMGLILAGLVCKPAVKLKKFFFASGEASKASRLPRGADIVHAGAALLLIGGFAAGLFSREGYMALSEGAPPSDKIFSYREKELAVTGPSGEKLAAFPEEALKSGQTLEIPSAAFESAGAADGISPAFFLKISRFMKNAEAFPPLEPGPPLAKAPGSKTAFGEDLSLREKKPEKEPADNRAGLIFQALPPAGALGPPQKPPKNPAAALEPELSLLERRTRHQKLFFGGKAYTLRLQPRSFRLPFQAELIDFEKKNYPGTNRPRSFQSAVYIIEGGVRSRRLIKMNRPLRRRGWTLYQASFAEAAPGHPEGRPEMSILAAVRNPARGFPYLAGLIMCFGLALHIAGRLLPGRRPRP